jgi:GNAT-family acetyltransferase (TIGR03103 family)
VGADSDRSRERFVDQPPSYQYLTALAGGEAGEGLQEQASIYCGWGRVIMGHTYPSPGDIATEMLQESRGKRDIAMYVADPHVVLAAAPQQLFLDPSDTFRLDLDAPLEISPRGEVTVRRVASRIDAELLNQLYLKRDMVPTDPEYVWSRRDSRKLLFLVAEDALTGDVVGTVTGINHRELFRDQSRGSSLWCLAVDPQAQRPGIGELLVRSLANMLREAGCHYMDLSVLHDNEQAKQLYRKLGFRQIHTFALKSKNAYNENLFLGPDLDERLNPYARLIVDEARSRGITVEILDAEEGYFRLSRGGKQVNCRESLSDFTSAVAMSRCQDKYVTHRWLRKAGLSTPAFRLAGQQDANVAFLEKHGEIVVKPTIGEQGRGISVGVSNEQELNRALELARRYGERVMLESFHPGQDLRIVVIGYEVVAAAVRRPPQVIGDGVTRLETLIEKQSRRRSAATGGESSIPIDAETERCLARQDLSLDAVPETGRVVEVRRTANLHTGGTIHDVTFDLHPQLIAAAEEAARHLDIPVVGFDFIVEAPDKPRHVIIEANERVGLANHEPQPTAERFIDLLFPLSISVRESAEAPRTGPDD